MLTRTNSRQFEVEILGQRQPALGEVFEIEIGPRRERFEVECVDHRGHVVHAYPVSAQGDHMKLTDPQREELKRLARAKAPVEDCWYCRHSNGHAAECPDEPGLADVEKRLRKNAYNEGWRVGRARAADENVYAGARRKAYAIGISHGDSAADEYENGESSWGS